MSADRATPAASPTYVAQVLSIAASYTRPALPSGDLLALLGTDRISDHFACEGCQSRAVDIFAGDGLSYSASCCPCRIFTEETIGFGQGRPDQVGQPWSDLVGTGSFSDGDHQDHLHAGWRQAS